MFLFINSTKHAFSYHVILRFSYFVLLVLSFILYCAKNKSHLHEEKKKCILCILIFMEINDTELNCTEYQVVLLKSCSDNVIKQRKGEKGER